jgi:hypothetical protein
MCAANNGVPMGPKDSTNGGVIARGRRAGEKHRSRRVRAMSPHVHRHFTNMPYNFRSNVSQDPGPVKQFDHFTCPKFRSWVEVRALCSAFSNTVLEHCARTLCSNNVSYSQHHLISHNPSTHLFLISPHNSLTLAVRLHLQHFPTPPSILQTFIPQLTHSHPACPHSTHTPLSPPSTPLPSFNTPTLAPLHPLPLTTLHFTSCPALSAPRR